MPKRARYKNGEYVRENELKQALREHDDELLNEWHIRPQEFTTIVLRSGRSLLMEPGSEESLRVFGEKQLEPTPDDKGFIEVFEPDRFVRVHIVNYDVKEV